MRADKVSLNRKQALEWILRAWTEGELVLETYITHEGKTFSGLCSAVRFLKNQHLITEEMSEELAGLIFSDKTLNREHFIWELSLKGHEERIKWLKETLKKL